MPDYQIFLPYARINVPTVTHGVDLTRGQLRDLLETVTKALAELEKL